MYKFLKTAQMSFPYKNPIWESFKTVTLCACIVRVHCRDAQRSTC